MLIILWSFAIHMETVNTLDVQKIIYCLVVIKRAGNICSYNKVQYNYNIIIVNEADKFMATSIQVGIHCSIITVQDRQIYSISCYKCNQSGPLWMHIYNYNDYYYYVI